VGVDHDEWCGDLPSRVLTGLMMQVIIEFSSARGKRRTVVKGGERFYLIPWISRLGATNLWADNPKFA
jgi:hypothetical protein